MPDTDSLLVSWKPKKLIPYFDFRFFTHPGFSTTQDHRYLTTRNSLVHPIVTCNTEDVLNQIGVIPEIYPNLGSNVDCD
ncbi:hypothetical protein HanIR_Chr05g0228561 [Helianthus annuus]|nr:hypothetical protein HanIR_Chr05g0228561 [Helianthus annuus]